MLSLQAALAALALSGAGPAVLLDFYSDTCGPCRAMEPTIQALVAEGHRIQKVNVAQHAALAAQYHVRSVPCYVMLVDGREVDRVVGGTSFSRLQRMCRLGAPSRPPDQAGLAHGAASEGISPAAWRAGPPVAIPPAGSRPLFAAATGQAPGALDEELIAASVRLRIEDADGHSCGSGTIIDAREGEALILTCGHIFRDSRGKGAIEVDLFGPLAAAGISGRLISYDLRCDVALVAIRTPGPVTTARLAPAGYRVRPGDEVVSVGCNNGNRPTARHSRVTSLDKFELPPNIQVAGQPVLGRSGGGLFSGDGLVIGVCNAADPTDHEGLFAGLASVHAELDEAGLAHIYGAPPTDLMPRGTLVAVDPPPVPKQMPRRPDRPAAAESAVSRGLGSVAAGTVSAAGSDLPRLSAAEEAALEELCRTLEEGAEVICVVRSRRDPQAKSEIILLDKVSPNFVKRLAAVAGAQGSAELIQTSRKRQPADDSTGGGNAWQPRGPRRGPEPGPRAGTAGLGSRAGGLGFEGYSADVGAAVVPSPLPACRRCTPATAAAR